MRSGYSGRQVLAEFLAMNDPLRQAILAGQSKMEWQRLAPSDGLKPLRT